MATALRCLVPLRLSPPPQQAPANSAASRLLPANGDEPCLPSGCVGLALPGRSRRFCLLHCHLLVPQAGTVTSQAAFTFPKWVEGPESPKGWKFLFVSLCLSAGSCSFSSLRLLPVGWPLAQTSTAVPCSHLCCPAQTHGAETPLPRAIHFLSC